MMSRNRIGCFARKGHLASPLWAIHLVVILSCHRAPTVQRFVTSEPDTSWSHVFTERRLELRMPPDSAPLLQIGKVLLDRRGHLVVPDGRAHRILIFDSTGTFLRQIGGPSDRTFRVRTLGSVALDESGNIWAYDVDGSKVTVLAQPTFNVVRRFSIEGPFSDFIVLHGGQVVTYYPADKAGAFKLFAQDGAELRSVQRMEPPSLRIFHGRIQNGGVAEDSSGDLFGIEPSKFALLRFSKDLRVRESFRPGPDSAWAPDAKAFPTTLDPYDYTPAHERWWDSFLHIGRPFALGHGILLVSLFTSHGMGISQEFANVYRTDGRVLAQGLRIPHTGHIVGAAGDAIYAVRNGHLVNDSTIAPLEFYMYRLRSSIASQYALRSTNP